MKGQTFRSNINDCLISLEVETFKYPKRLLYDFDLYEWYIPDLKVRDKIENLYKGVNNKDNVFISDIVKIEYSRKVIYEDKELLNDKNNMLEETHDITDEMFDQILIIISNFYFMKGVILI